MSGRLLLGSSRRLSKHSLIACWALALNSAPALAQTDAPEAPIAPSAPPIAPPEADPPAPAPSVPGPPSQAPLITEPTPAATPDQATPTPTPAPAPGTEPKLEPPASSAAFAPLPVATREIAKPQATHSVPPAEAPPSARAKPVSHAAHGDESKNDHDSGGLMGPFRIGVLVGTGLPELANFGAQLKLTRFVGLGVNVGLIPTVKISYYGQAAQSYQEYDAYGHIYPFGGSFFLGAGAGYVKIDGTLFNRFNVSNVSVDVTSDASVRTLVLTPQLGFLKIFDVGFAIGFDIGAQIPIAPSQVEFNTVAPGVPPELADRVQRDYINPNDEKVRRTLNTLGRTPLPTFNFKIGWFL